METRTPIAYYATALPMLQAIPVVVDAAPGIVYPTVFTTAVPDLRQLSAVGAQHQD